MPVGRRVIWDVGTVLCGLLLSALVGTRAGRPCSPLSSSTGTLRDWVPVWVLLWLFLGIEGKSLYTFSSDPVTAREAL